MMVDKELDQLKKKIVRLEKKAEKIGYEYNDIDLSAIRKTMEANSMNDLNWLAIQHIERLYNRLYQ